MKMSNELQNIFRSCSLSGLKFPSTKTIQHSVAARCQRRQSLEYLPICENSTVPCGRKVDKY
jgi:hypothetical protein